MISICIPMKNDFDCLDECIDHLFLTSTGDVEILLFNDGSVFPCGKHRPLRIDRPDVVVINSLKSRGVGAAFDRCVEKARGEIIILQGIDVYPRAGWYDKVIKAIENYPDSIGCSACIGLTKTNHDLDREGAVTRYGADLLVTMNVDDLPESSDLRKKKPNYRELFKGKWRPGKEQDTPYEISSLMGAHYYTTKEFYQRIGGFDTLQGSLYRGHKTYGSLEPYLSMKAWLSGGSVFLHPEIEAGHEFSRIEKLHRYAKGPRSAINMWWNKIFIAETMVMDETLRRDIINYPLREKNFLQALKLIKNNYSEVLSVREQNRLRFTRDLQWLMEKFNIKTELTWKTGS